MTGWRLIGRSLRHYAAGHFPVGLATAICTAVITGSLLVGDSVRESLLHLVRLRLGRVTHAVVGGDRLPAAALGRRLAAETGFPTAAILRLSGVVSVPGTKLRLPGVRVLGVDENFAVLSPDGHFPLPRKDGATVSSVVAQRLGLQVGSTLIVRVERVGPLPRGTPLAARQSSAVALRLRVGAIADDRQFGRYSLREEHLPPNNLFVSRKTLCEALDLDDRANVILVAGESGHESAAVATALAHCWHLDDVGLEIHTLPGDTQELVSRRIFLGRPVSTLAASHAGTVSVLTTFANEFRHGTASTPYSFVTGTDAPWLPADLGEDEMMISRWLADDLHCGKGDSLELTYLKMGPMGALETHRASFTVRDVYPLRPPFADPSLTPNIPGLSDADSCTEWDPGIPIDLHTIRDKDEAYWKRWKGTPKAFLSLAAARKLWANPFGDATALRFTGMSAEDVRRFLRAKIPPDRVGLQLQEVLADGLRAGRQSVDFAQLFLGLSFFLIVAALLLMGLLFVLAAEVRSDQIGTLLALGFSPRRIRRLLFAEGCLVAVPSVTLGVLLGMAYNRGVVWALTGVWRGTVGAVLLQPHITARSLLIGWLSGLVMSLLVFRLVLRRLSGKTVQGLRVGSAPSVSSRHPLLHLLPGGGCLLAGLTLVLLGSPGRGRAAAGTFFAAGSLLLTGGLWLFYLVSRYCPALKIGILSFRNLARRRFRSVAVAGVLAASVFLIVAVGANRHDPSRRRGGRASGTGGFALYAETTLPLPADPNTAAGREKLGLEASDLAGVRIVSFMVSAGDDASCLNLNRSSRPRILGVDPKKLADPAAFSFVKMAEDHVDPKKGWQVLDTDLGSGKVPAIADNTVIVWGLGLKVGDSLTIEDSSGRKVDLVFVAGLANSVLQGSVVISDRAFRNLFPGEDGVGVMLLDVPDTRLASTRTILADRLSDYGFWATPCGERLAAFNAVENTYLAIFLALGGLGLVLGSAGLAAVVMRNVMERRGELALLRAVGFGRGAVLRMVTVEHAVLLVVGLCIGLAAGLIAVLPAFAGPGGAPDLRGVALWCAFVLTAGFFWIVTASLFATRGDPVKHLRDTSE